MSLAILRLVFLKDSNSTLYVGYFIRYIFWKISW